MIIGGQILRNDIAICEISKISQQTGKLRMNEDLGSLRGPIIPLGALVEHLRNSESDKARIHQFGKKVLPKVFKGYALIAGKLERRTKEQLCFKETL